MFHILKTIILKILIFIASEIQEFYSLYLMTPTHECLRTDSTCHIKAVASTNALECHTCYIINSRIL